MASASSMLMSLPESGVTLDELAARANAILASRGFVAEDSRSASRVDSRTVRFYQTIGVLPKPAYEGRRALYSLTHLLRLVAAKQLQSEGYTLAQIQATLPARTDRHITRALTEAESVMQQGSRVLPGAKPPSRPSSTGSTPELRAFTLAKGVTLLVDPTSAQDPAALAKSLADALARTVHSSQL